MSLTVRAVLCVIEEDGFPDLPPQVTMGGQTMTIYTHYDTTIDGVYREYRIPGTDRLVVFRKGPQVILPDGRTVCLCLCFTPSDGPTGDNSLFDLFSAYFIYTGEILGVWRPTLRDDGDLVYAVDSDHSEAAVLARSLWPWRLPSDTDPTGYFDSDGFWVPYEGPLTGAYTSPRS